jgi:hypothetical protein
MIYQKSSQCRSILKISSDKVFQIANYVVWKIEEKNTGYESKNSAPGDLKVGGLYTIEWREYKPDIDVINRPGKVVHKLRLTKWVSGQDPDGDTIMWPSFEYEDILFNRLFGHYMEISQGWDMFFNTIIVDEDENGPFSQ